MLKAVLFDVDFTLFRPGPELGPEGYRRVGERHGLTLDPDRYPEARAAAIEKLSGERDFVHDEEVWVAFTEQIVLGMGADPAGARACAVDMVREWERHENFSLYEDALPVLVLGQQLQPFAADPFEHAEDIGILSLELAGDQLFLRHGQ